ncbi:MAG: protein translocase subunit SecF [Deltaproteobacteria bacterium]|nr:protein translocase subunit SecF [Deltaproteobacteria bacterium]
MEFFKPNLYIDFMGKRKLFFLVSLGALALSAILFFVPGPNWGTDFKGGTEMEVLFKRDIGPAQIRGALSKIGQAGAEVVASAGNPRQYMVRVGAVSSLTDAQFNKARNSVKAAFRNQGVKEFSVSPSRDKFIVRLGRSAPDAEMQQAIADAGLRVVRVSSQTSRGGQQRYEIVLEGLADEMLAGLRRNLGANVVPEQPLRVEWVGPKAGEQLRSAAAKSMIYALLFIMIYVAFRFDLRFAPSAIVGVVWSVSVTAGVVIAARLEVSLSIIAALLTVIGYGINDTVVAYDRIRENMQRAKSKSFPDLINLSLSQNLGRTLLTGVTVLFNIGAFIVWGTPSIRNMAITILVGIAITTYSSIFIAAPLTEWLDRRFFSKQSPTSGRTSSAKA